MSTLALVALIAFCWLVVGIVAALAWGCFVHAAQRYARNGVCRTGIRFPRGAA